MLAVSGCWTDGCFLLDSLASEALTERFTCKQIKATVMAQLLHVVPLRRLILTSEGWMWADRRCAPTLKHILRSQIKWAGGCSPLNFNSAGWESPPAGHQKECRVKGLCNNLSSLVKGGIYSIASWCKVLRLYPQTQNPLWSCYVDQWGLWSAQVEFTGSDWAFCCCSDTCAEDHGWVKEQIESIKPVSLSNCKRCTSHFACDITRVSA